MTDEEKAEWNDKAAEQNLANGHAPAKDKTPAAGGKGKTQAKGKPTAAGKGKPAAGGKGKGNPAATRTRQLAGEGKAPPKKK